MHFPSVQKRTLLWIAGSMAMAALTAVTFGLDAFGLVSGDRKELGLKVAEAKVMMVFGFTAVVFMASCMNAPAVPSDPAFAEGEATAVLLDYLRDRELCEVPLEEYLGILVRGGSAEIAESSLRMVRDGTRTWKFEEAAFSESNLQNGAWLVEADNKSWKVFENTRTVLRVNAPAECQFEIRDELLDFGKWDDLTRASIVLIHKEIAVRLILKTVPAAKKENVVTPTSDESLSQPRAISLRQMAKKLDITPADLSMMVNGKRPWREGLGSKYFELVTVTAKVRR